MKTFENIQKINEEHIEPKYIEMKYSNYELFNIINDLIKVYEDENNYKIFLRIKKDEKILVLLVDMFHIVIRIKNKCEIGYVIRDELIYLYECDNLTAVQYLKYLL